MDKENLFAFAVNAHNTFEKAHFGDADKFVVYKWTDEAFLYVDAFENAAKSFDESKVHGSELKAQQIVNQLNNHSVNFIVSTQFGKNIKIVQKHFVPLVIRASKPEDVFAILASNIELIMSELSTTENNFRVFSVFENEVKRIG